MGWRCIILGQFDLPRCSAACDIGVNRDRNGIPEPEPRSFQDCLRSGAGGRCVTLDHDVSVVWRVGREASTKLR